MILFRSNRDQTLAQQRNTARVCTLSRAFHKTAGCNPNFSITLFLLKIQLGCDTRFFSHLIMDEDIQTCIGEVRLAFAPEDHGHGLPH